MEYTSGTFAIYHGGGCPGGVIPIFTKTVYFMKNSFWEIIFYTFLCLFAIKKVG